MDETPEFFASFESFQKYEHSDLDGNWTEGLQASLERSPNVGPEDVKSDGNWSVDFDQTFQQNDNVSSMIELNSSDQLSNNENHGLDDSQFEEISDFESFQQSLETPLQKNRGIVKSCFHLQENINSLPVSLLEKRVKDSSTFLSIQEQIHDPIKAKKTLSNKLKLEQVHPLLDFNKTKEEWLIKVQECEIGTFRRNFDFHNDSRNKKQISNKEKSQRSKEKVNGEVAKEEPDRRRYSHENSSTAQVVLEYNGTSQKLLELEAEMKKAFIDLSSKSVGELRTLVEELEVEAKIYSELLLSELDLRDDLLRQQELKNKFISKHVAVERKVNEAKKKKRGYTFFKYPEDTNTKILEWTIPYFYEELGPTTTEISLLTELLSAIEREDPETPKLISEYVFKVGNSYNLDTRIQVRTQHGVKMINGLEKSTR